MVHEGVHRSFSSAAQCAWPRAGSKRSSRRKCRQQFSNPLADVGILFSGLAATPLSDFTEADARAKERRRSGNVRRNSWRDLSTPVSKSELQIPLSTTHATFLTRTRRYVTAFLSLGT